MKTDEKLHSIALISSTAVLFLILISSTALASITETRIGAPGGVTGLNFYNNKVVWSNLGGNIFIYDLSDKKETSIKDVRAYIGLSLFDNKIVYDNYQNNVSMYDLSTHKEIQITNSDGADDVPDTYGNKIVY